MTTTENTRGRPVGVKTIRSLSELAELPPESVVKERDTALSFVFWKAWDDTWCIPSDDSVYQGYEIHLPAVLLWSPSMVEGAPVTTQHSEELRLRRAAKVLVAAMLDRDGREAGEPSEGDMENYSRFAHELAGALHKSGMLEVSA